MKPQRYGPFPYSPIIDRPVLKWPNGSRLAVWVVPNIEFFPLNELIKGEAPETPDIFPWSRRDYGNRVGVFRLMDVLAKRQIRATVALNSEICLEHPRIIERGCELEWEFMGHNESNSRPTSKYGKKDERHVIGNVLKTIESVAGRRPLGWLGAGGSESWHSLENLAAEGVRYVADWINDDQPYVMKVGKPPLVSIPYSGDLNDASMINRKNVSSQEFGRMICRQFEILHGEAEASARVMCIALHPWIIGVPHRIGDLADALDFIVGKPGVWFATGSEITEAYLSQIA
ncbi:MAG TPA: polysaccharide deacetylase family protein [Beijerinckiaceae bacterium]|nr:polysaccharide deacetylase family protein [Beijerinckiaceae bacterium]